MISLTIRKTDSMVYIWFLSAHTQSHPKGSPMTSTLIESPAHSLTESPQADSPSVARLSQNVGGLISGITVSGEITDEEVEFIRTALAAHKVVIFQGQNHVDDETQYAFAKRLGTPTLAHPTVLSTGRDNLTIEGAANSWHTDVSFVDRIPKASILRAVSIPAYGGATQWANTVAAYNNLPEPLKVLADNLWAVHTNEYDYAAIDSKNRKGRKEHYEEFTKTVFETEHPVVRVHPDTGERSLLLGHFVKGFIGLRPGEFQDLFRIYQNRIHNSDNVFRWNWSEGDLVIWDNNATQHYGVNDFGDQYRKINRVTLAGSVPTSIDGEKSRIRVGDASHYSPIDEPAPLVGFNPEESLT